MVGILAERSVDLLVAVLAVWKAGGAYVPLDPDYPADRMRFMLEDSGAKVLLTQTLLREPSLATQRNWPGGAVPRRRNVIQRRPGAVLGSTWLPVQSRRADGGCERREIRVIECCWLDSFHEAVRVIWRT